MSKITIEGKAYSMRFTYSVLASIERETGKSFLNFDLDKIGVGDCIVMAYYGIKKAHPEFDLTIEDVGDNIGGGDFEIIFKQFTEDMSKGNSEKK